MKKTFDELIKETPLYDLLSVPEKDLVKELMRKVREATLREIESLSNQYREYSIADYAHEMPTDRITITDND